VKSSALAVEMRRCRRGAERVHAERHGDHEVAVDETGVLDRQDVGVVKLGQHPDFLAKVREEVVVHHAPVRDLQRDPEAVNGVERLVDGGQRPVREASLDPVFPQLLPGSEHVLWFLSLGWWCAPIRSEAPEYRANAPGARDMEFSAPCAL
jgi:hypothetical protein